MNRTSKRTDNFHSFYEKEVRMMNRKLTMAPALVGVFTVPMSAAYAEGDEEKKSEQSQLIAAESINQSLSAKAPRGSICTSCCPRS
jgi:hypothetical protein